MMKIKKLTFNDVRKKYWLNTMDHSNLTDGRDVYISRSARLYKDAIDIADKMYITLVDIEIKGDTFFPEFDESLFSLLNATKVDFKISI